MLPEVLISVYQFSRLCPDYNFRYRMRKLAGNIAKFGRLDNMNQ